MSTQYTLLSFNYKQQNFQITHIHTEPDPENILAVT
jgi:hypothetical protein